ncbi:hypothetical protein [Streptomyces flavidovirens]
MKKLPWILAALALLLFLPGLGAAVATAVTPAITWMAAQPVLLAFGLGAVAAPHLRRIPQTAKHA